MLKLHTTFLFVLIFSSNPLLAQVNFESDVSNRGTVAAAFLEIGVNARAQAMGGAYSAMRGSSDMIYWNPAGLAYVDGISGSFTNTQWLAETTFNFASFAIPIPGIKTVFATSFTTLGVPEQQVRSFNGNLTGEFYDARDYALNISVATRLIPSFSVAVSTKYISQRIWSEKATGLGFDFGVSYETPINGLLMGASITNFGGDMSMDGRNLNDIIDPDPNNEGVTNIPVKLETDEFPLPQMFRFGLAYEYNIDDFSTTTSIDLNHPRGSTESMNIGFETGFKDLIFLRAGYQNLFEDDHINGLTFGVGIQSMISSSKRFAFDYAMSDWGLLGNAHRFSMNFSL